MKEIEFGEEMIQAIRDTIIEGEAEYQSELESLISQGLCESLRSGFRGFIDITRIAEAHLDNSVSFNVQFHERAADQAPTTSETYVIDEETASKRTPTDVATRIREWSEMAPILRSLVQRVRELRQRPLQANVRVVGAVNVNCALGALAGGRPLALQPANTRASRATAVWKTCGKTTVFRRIPPDSVGL